MLIIVRCSVCGRVVMPKKNKLGNKNQPRNDGDFEGEWNEEVAESSIEDGSMSMSPDFPLYGNCTMNVGDSNDLHIYVNCKSDEDSSFLDNDFDNGMLLLNENESKNKSSSLCIKIFVMAWIIILILCVIFREKIGNVIKMFANKVSFYRIRFRNWALYPSYTTS